MKIAFYGAAVLFILALTGCSSDATKEIEPTVSYSVPTEQEFMSLQTIAFENIKQKFTAPASENILTITSEKGMKLQVTGLPFKVNGDPVTNGDLVIEFAEVYDRGTMAAINRPTIYDPRDSLLQDVFVTGGLFYANVLSNGKSVDAVSRISSTIPISITGNQFCKMHFNSWVNTKNNLTWEEVDIFDIDEYNFPIENNGTEYYASFKTAGWNGIGSYFFHAGTENTIITVEVPEGFNDTNSAVYLAYDNQRLCLSKLNGFNQKLSAFKDIRVNLYVGDKCNIIFATAKDGKWFYAIKPIVVTKEGILTFNYEDLHTATETQFKAAINALP